MDVTKETFPAVVDTIKNFIKTCDFYSIDTELTGVMVPGLTDALCDPPERNLALKGTVATRYSIIQFGLCTFHKDPASPTNGPDNYIARPFNFFLFPSEHPLQLGGGFDRSLERDLILNPGAISFNRRHKMDFQRWIYQGVEYCNGPLERRMEEFLDKEAIAEAAKKKLAAQRDVTLATLSSAEEKEYFIKCEKLAAEFMVEVSEEEAAKRPKELMLPSTKSRVARESTQAYLESTHSPNLLVALRGKFPARDLCLVRLSSEEMNKLRERQQASRNNRLSDFVGFRTIFKTMVESKKPIVGHNCLVDILFMLTAFDEPLALNSLTDLKARLNSQFPLVFDTKAIAVNTDYFPEGRFESKTLEPLYINYKDKPIEGMPTVTLPLGFQSYEEATLLKARAGLTGAHEAGFDALMTGKLLLNLLTESKLISSGKAENEAKKKANSESKATSMSSDSPFQKPHIERSNQSSSPLFDKAAPAFGNFVHLHRSLYLMDLGHRDAAKEALYEGGSTDVFTAQKNGVAILTYSPSQILAPHILESRVLSIGYEAAQVLEICPGLAAIVFSDKAIAEISKRSGIPIGSAESASSTTAPSDGTQYYTNQKLVEEAIKEINTKLNPVIKAEIFVPYHFRERKAKERRVLGRCSHPSLLTGDQNSSPLHTVPPEVLAACDPAFGNAAGSVTLNPLTTLTPSVVASILTEQKRQLHTSDKVNRQSLHTSAFALAASASSARIKTMKNIFSPASILRRFITKH